MAGALSWSVGLFIAGGAVWFLIGALTLPMMNTDLGRSSLIFSNSVDNKTFGAPPREVLEGEPNVAKLRTIVLRMLAGFLVVAGILVMAVAWFGWRHNQAWALWTLTATALAVVPFWIASAWPAVEAGARIRLADVPPFMWVTTALWAPAILTGVLAWWRTP